MFEKKNFKNKEYSNNQDINPYNSKQKGNENSLMESDEEQVKGFRKGSLEL